MNPPTDNLGPDISSGAWGLPCRCDRVLLALLDGHSPIRSRWSTVAFALACGPTLMSRSTAQAPKGLWLSAIQPEGLFLLQHDVDRPHQLSCGCHDGDLLPPPLAHLLIESRYGRIVLPNVDAGALDHYPVHQRVPYALRGMPCLSRLTHTGRQLCVRAEMLVVWEPVDVRYLAGYEEGRI